MVVQVQAEEAARETALGGRQQLLSRLQQEHTEIARAAQRCARCCVAVSCPSHRENSRF